MGYVRGAVWLRFEIENADAAERAWSLTYDYPMVEELDVHVGAPGRTPARYRGGIAVPAADRRVVNRGPFHEVPIVLAPHARAEVHVRVVTRGSMMIGVTLQETEAVGQRFLRLLAAQGLNLGVLLALTILNLYFWVALRDRSHAHLALLIVAFAGYELAVTGLGAAFLWTDAPRWTVAAPSLFAALSVPLGLRFARRFLGVTEVAPRLDGARHVAWTALPCAILALVDVRAANTLTSVVGVLTLFVVLAWAFASLRAGYRPARFFFGGLVGFFVAALAFVATTLGVLAPNPVAFHGMHFGFSFASIVFACALADRVRSADRLATAALEAAVRERTRQLEESVGALRREADERRRAEAARRESEEHLRRAQRIEAVGRLAGGVAHDYNNLLTSVSANVGFLLLDLPADDPRRGVLEEMADAVERGAKLTRQLLALGRIQVVEPRPLAVNGLVENLRRLLTRLLGGNVELRLALDPGAELVLADPAQLEQVVVNLVLNARDALPSGGRITLTTRTVEVVAGAEPVPDARPGRYLRLEVADTGLGIPPDVARHLFEPFFTTKAEGKGSGLGLATVHGIVVRHGGFVEVDPNPGRGAVFRVHFPVAEGAAAAASPRAAPRPLPGGTERILLAEDEHVVREGTARLLERLGYQVFAARDAGEALRIAEEQGPFDLLLADVVLGDLTGRELALRLGARAPGVRVVLASGHARDVLGEAGVTTGDVHFVAKPFTPAVLASKVRAALDAPAPAPMARRRGVG
jgi:signal transduction histidine kinase/ActR/RegA family two-component response regulator